mgnify:CR=1 FL=1
MRVADKSGRSFETVKRGYLSHKEKESKSKISDKALLKEIGDNARKMAVTDATQRICEIVLGLIKK